jgi:uridine phosphorylase
MEGAALVGLARLLGHEAVTNCYIIADRVHHTMNADYCAKSATAIAGLIEKILQKLITN